MANDHLLREIIDLTDRLESVEQIVRRGTSRMFPGGDYDLQAEIEELKQQIGRLTAMVESINEIVVEQLNRHTVS